MPKHTECRAHTTVRFRLEAHRLYKLRQTQAVSSIDKKIGDCEASNSHLCICKHTASDASESLDEVIFYSPKDKVIKLEAGHLYQAIISALAPANGMLLGGVAGDKSFSCLALCPTTDTARTKKCDASVPLGADAVPVAPMADAPVAPADQAPAPVAPADQAPVTPVAPADQSPVTPVADQAPVTLMAEQALVTPVADAPVAPADEALVTPVADAPVPPADEALVTPVADAPVPPATKAVQNVLRRVSFELELLATSTSPSLVSPVPPKSASAVFNGSASDAEFDAALNAALGTGLSDASETDTAEGDASEPASETDAVEGDASKPASETDAAEGDASDAASETDAAEGDASEPALEPALETDAAEGAAEGDASEPALETDAAEGAASEPALETDAAEGAAEGDALETDAAEGAAEGDASEPALETDAAESAAEGDALEIEPTESDLTSDAESHASDAADESTVHQQSNDDVHASKRQKRAVVDASDSSDSSDSSDTADEPTMSQQSEESERPVKRQKNTTKPARLERVYVGSRRLKDPIKGLRIFIDAINAGGSSSDQSRPDCVKIVQKPGLTRYGGKMYSAARWNSKTKQYQNFSNYPQCVKWIRDNLSMDMYEVLRENTDGRFAGKLAEDDFVAESQVSGTTHPAAAPDVSMQESDDEDCAIV